MPFDEIRDVIENTSSPQTRLRVYKKEQKTTYHVAFSPCSDKRKIFIHKNENMIIVQILYKTMGLNIRREETRCVFF